MLISVANKKINQGFFQFYILIALYCMCGMSSELKNYTPVAFRQTYHL